MTLTGDALIRVQADVSNALTGMRALEASLKQASGQAGNVTGQTTKMSQAVQGMKGTLGGLSQQVLGVNLATIGMAGAVGLAGKTIVDSTRHIIAFNKSILDSARATGMGVEEFSRMAEVADDMGIGLEKFEAALRMMTKRGLAPTIDSLAQLADRANAMNSPVERAQYLAKVMGKQWASLDPLLQLGGERMKELAGAIEDGLVVTEEEIRKTEEFRLGLEALTDSWLSFKNELGMGVVSAYVDLAGQAEEHTVRWEQAVQALLVQGIKPTRNEIDEMYRKLQAAERIEALGRIKDDFIAVADAAGEAKDAVEEFVSDSEAAFKEQVAALAASELENQKYKASVDDISAAIAALRDRHVVITVTTITEEVTRRTWEWREAMNTPNTGGGHGSSTGGEQMAAGGPIRSPVVEVGEEGAEGIVNGVVIPHQQWMAMKRLGVVPSRGRRLGGDVESGGLGPGWNWRPTVKWTPDTSQSFKTNEPINGQQFSIYNPDSILRGGGGGGGSTSAISEAVSSAAAQAAEGAAVSVASVIPGAISHGISQQTAQQVQIQIAGNQAMTSELRAVRREIQTLNGTIVRAVRDAVASL
jgi:hypothetical protein